MTRVIEWLLSLDNIRWGHDAPLHLKWDTRPAPWLIAALMVVVVALVVTIYRRERTSLGRRIVLAGLRFSILALVAAVLCGPALVLERVRVEASHVALLVDTSLSMARKDGDAAKTESRMESLSAAMRHDDSAALRTLLARNGLEVLSFSGHVETRAFAASAEELKGIVDAMNQLQPEGGSTDLAGAISQTVQRSQGRRLAAIVLASDGRASAGGSLADALDSARGRQIPIYPLRLGSTSRVVDAEVATLRAEPTVYLQDQVVVEAKICVSGADGAPMAVTVKLFEERTVTPVATRTLTLATSPQPDANRPAGSSSTTDFAEPACGTVELRAKPKQPGTIRYRIEVEALPGEEIQDNNVDSIDVAVRDARLRVLFVEGYPRYEYRYLKNALLREPTIDLSVLLLEADDQFVQEGTDPVRRFPETPEELSRFDAVVFGDVDPRGGWLSAAQSNMLLDFVGNEGGGFGIIAGERFAPQRFLGSTLEKLIPVRIDREFLGHYETALTEGFKVVLTPEGRATRLFQVSGAAGQSDTDGNAAEVFDGLPELYWIAQTLGAKPGATVLAHHPTLRTRVERHENAQALPILVLARYGAGRILFQGTDDTWRWRRHRVAGLPAGELLHDVYWMQLARMLSPAHRAGANPRFLIRTDRRAYPFGTRVRTEVEVLDSQLLSQLGDNVRLSLQDISGASDGESQTAAERGFLVNRLDAGRRSAESSIFETAFTPMNPGRYQLKLDDVVSRPGERNMAATFKVDRPDLESRRPDADHATLEAIAQATGGEVLELNQLASSFANIRDRSAQTPDDVVEPLSDSKLVLILFALMIGLEWTLRKVFGLL